MVNERTGAEAPVLLVGPVMLEVELQGKLYLSSVLRCANDTVACIRFCEVRMVEQIEEVRAELKSF